MHLCARRGRTPTAACHGVHVSPQLRPVTFWQFSPEWLQPGHLRTSMFLSQGTLLKLVGQQPDTVSIPETHRPSGVGQGDSHEGREPPLQNCSHGEWTCQLLRPGGGVRTRGSTESPKRAEILGQKQLLWGPENNRQFPLTPYCSIWRDAGRNRCRLLLNHTASGRVLSIKTKNRVGSLQHYAQ